MIKKWSDEEISKVCEEALRTYDHPLIVGQLASMLLDARSEISALKKLCEYQVIAEMVFQNARNDAALEALTSFAFYVAQECATPLANEAICELHRRINALKGNTKSL